MHHLVGGGGRTLKHSSTGDNPLETPAMSRRGLHGSCGAGMSLLQELQQSLVQEFNSFPFPKEQVYTDNQLLLFF